MSSRAAAGADAAPPSAQEETAISGQALANGLLLGAVCWLGLFALGRVAWVLGGWPAVLAGGFALAGLTAVILLWPAPSAGEKESR